jgi:hypothetical protein
MTLEELATICKDAPIPFFVKVSCRYFFFCVQSICAFDTCSNVLLFFFFIQDENSVYRYVNAAFCEFILDTVCKENILNKNTTQVIQGKEGEDVVKTDNYIMSREGKIITFNVAVNRQEYRVMKRYTKLRDGQKVVVGAVISSV